MIPLPSLGLAGGGGGMSQTGDVKFAPVFITGAGSTNNGGGGMSWLWIVALAVAGWLVWRWWKK
jgi:hypothetical protein